MRLLDNLHGLFRARHLVANELVDGFALGGFVHLEPVHQALPHHLVDVARGGHGFRQGVVGVDDDDLVVHLALVDERVDTQHLDLDNRTRRELLRADLHHIQRISIPLMPGLVLLLGVLPRLRQHAVVEERHAVAVVAGLVVLDVLHDGVVLGLLVDLELLHAPHRDLDHHVHDRGVAVASGGVELQVMPGRDVLPLVVLEEQRPRGLAELALLHKLPVSGHEGLRHHARIADPLGVLGVLVVLDHELPAVFDHEAVGDARLGFLPVLGDHVGARRRALLRERAHGRTRDGQEVRLARLVRRAHLVGRLVVVHLGEGEDLHLAETRRRLQHVAPVVAVVEVAARGHLARRLGALDAGGVAPGDEEARADVAAGLAVPLDLGGAGVDHGGRPDGHDGVGGEHTFLDDDLVLVDAHVERHVVGLGPAAERREPEQRLLVAHRVQLASSILHEVGVSGVSRVTRLESVHGISTGGNEALAELGRGETVVVHAIVVADALEELDLTAEEVGSTLEHLLDVRVLGVDASEDARDDLLLAVVVDLRIRQHSHALARRGDEGDGFFALDHLLGGGGDGQDDGHRHVDAVAQLQLGGVVIVVGLLLSEVGVAREVEWVDEHRVVVQGLQQDALPHESLEWCSPSLADTLYPLQVDVAQKHLREVIGSSNGVSGHLGCLPRHAAIRWNQGRVPLGCVLCGCEHSGLSESLDDLSHFLVEAHLVAAEDDFRVVGFLVGSVQASQALNLARLPLRIYPLRIPRLGLIDGHINEDFEERQPLLHVKVTHTVTIRSVGGDEAGDGDDAGLGKERGNFADAANVFLSVSGGHG
mmetsp:Transcript_8887/g.16890  ORF Transcript_8887/g.16890 Transcript_8887/m.16890 type:complete len:819 (-) Transcript_8887:890-3346(-)